MFSPSSFYCSRRDAADNMPLKALVLIFVSLPLSPFLVLGASFFVAVGIVLRMMHYY